jgi:uncharacterized protein with HEPN domain
MPTENPRRRLADIRDNADRIAAHVAGMDRQAFLSDQKTLDAVERCLERIAEAARRIGDRFDARYPHLELVKLRRFGSVLRHDYGSILPESLWVYVNDDVPPIREMAETEIARIDRGEEAP